ncbi:MAG: ABC transporter permease [Bacilli bacterium]
MKTIIKQDFFNLLKNKPIMMYLVIYPPLLIIVTGFVFQNYFNNEILSSYDYYGINILVFLTTASVIILPELMFGSNVKHVNFRIIYSPISREKMYISKIIVAVIVPFIIFSSYIFIFNLFKIVNYGSNNAVDMIIIEFFLLLFSISFGGAFCVFSKNEDLSTKILNLIVNLLAAISGVFFPVYLLGKNIEKISIISPISLVLNTIYEIIYDGNFASFIPTISILLFFSVIFISLIHLNYHPEKY